jgi:hypothetical protein
MIAAPGREHSGTIVGVRGETLTLEEMGSWTRGRPGIVRRSIVLTPGTRVEIVQRSKKMAPGQWPGGFEETPVVASRLRPGEFATVATERRDGRLIAREIAVVRLSPDEQGARR